MLLMKNGLITIIKNENKKNNSRKMDRSSTDYASSNKKIWTPLLDLNKEEIIDLAFDNDVPLEKTWSCYSGNSKPCGKCDSCRIRNVAYEKWLNKKNKQ